MYRFGVFLEHITKGLAFVVLFTIIVGVVMVVAGWAKGFGDDFAPFAGGGLLLTGLLFWISDGLKKAGVSEPPEKKDESPGE